MDYKILPVTRVRLILTEQCQLSCKYCYERYTNRKMPLDIAKRSIDMAITNAAASGTLPEITLFGGEPLIVYEELMKPCIEYIRETLQSRATINFTTNGLLLDEDKLKYFRENNVNFMLSIDGCKEAHNTNRVYPDGSWSYDEIEEKIPTILRYYPNMKARMTVTPSTVKYLHSSVLEMEDLGFIDMHVIPDLLGEEWTDLSIQTLEEQLRLIEYHIREKFNNHEVPLIFKTLADMFPRIVLSSHCEKVGHHRTAKCCSPDRRCGLGVLGNVTVDTSGNFFSCPHGEQDPLDSNVLYLGNVSQGVDEDKVKRLLDMNQEPLRCETLNCTECPLNTVCTGGCVPNNYMITGDFTILPRSYCLWTRKLYESATRIIEYFDTYKEDLMFKDYFYGVVKRGVICVC